MNTKPDMDNSTNEVINDIQFSDIFNIGDIQRLQDLFADAHGVASIITDTEGTPITRPSSFCRLCDDIIRKTEKGRANCYQSDSVLGSHNSSGPVVQLCLSGGLWDAGASITVGGKHIANWLIGQVRNEESNEQRMILYADEIGANKEDFRKALNEVPVMSFEQFNKVSKMLFAFANELSEKAYSNLQLKMQIAEREKETEQLRETEERYRMLFEQSNDAIFQVDIASGNYLDANRSAEILTGKSRNELKSLKASDLIRKGANERLERLVDTNEALLMGEVEYFRPDGTIRTALLNTISLYKGHVFGIAHDITERKQLDEALRNSLALTEATIESIHNGILVVSNQGLVIKANAKFAEMWHIRGDILASGSDKTLIDSILVQLADPDEFIATVSELYGKPEAQSLDLIYFKDGRIFKRISRPLFLGGEPKGRVWSFLDITERKLAEQELIVANKELAFQNEEKEKRAAELTGSKQLLDETERLARIGGWEINLKKNELNWSDVVYQIYEVEPDYQPTVESTINFYAPEAIPVIYKAVNQAIVEGKSFDVDLQLITAKQNRIWIRAIGQAYRVNGEIVKIGGMFQDINERKMAEQELIVANKELLFQNKEKGKRADELIIANKELAFQHDEKDKRAAELIIANNELVFQNDEKGKRADELIIANKELVFQNEEKEKRADELIIADKELLFQNKEKEKRAAELIIANKELHFQNEEKGKRADELIIANKELAFQHDEKDKRAAELIIANNELVFQNDEKEKRADELIIANKELAFQNDEKEKRADELIIANKELAFQNYEKEKRAAELIIAKEHAEESNRLKTAFLNNISHEIRTPFNGILGFLSILEDNNLTESERYEYTSIINKSAYRLMNTINDIVEISQIQAGQMKLTASETNIKRMTGELFDLFKPDAESQGLEFTITNDLPNYIESISTDGVKLKTILSILIGNAIKFTKAGSIEFGIKCNRDTACRVPITAEIEFSVKDTGIGIPENKQQAIFERFMQVDGSNTRQFEGSGLGLSIASAYAEMLGGKIWVESDPEGKSGGKGSVFYFTIPYNCKPQEKNVARNLELADKADNQVNPEGSAIF